MLEGLHYSISKDFDKIALIGHALSSPIRLEILKMLTYNNLTLKEIASELDIPLNTLTNHISIMEKAGIINTQAMYTTKGKSKSCSRVTDTLSITFFDPATDYHPYNKFEEHLLPVGSFFDFIDLSAPCGMASHQGNIGCDNDLSLFLSAERSTASLIWFTSGLLEYRVPLPPRQQLQNLSSIEISLEVCSEVPLYNNHALSDISLFLNDRKLGVYTSPGDYGDRPGLLNPEHWPIGLTQYGKLINFKIDKSQCTLNSEFLSFVNLHDLALDQITRPYLSLKIGVEADADHVGGINLFGKDFGDYAQDIIFKYHY